MIQEDSLSCLETAETQNIRISKVLKVEKNKKNNIRISESKALLQISTRNSIRFHQVPPSHPVASRKMVPFQSTKAH
jgi:hypothetical protein